MVALNSSHADAARVGLTTPGQGAHQAGVGSLLGQEYCHLRPADNRALEFLRDSRCVSQVVNRQVRAGLDGLSAQQARGIVIAYEPVWAIGTGLAATAEVANRAHKDYIRVALSDMFGEEVAQAVRILYGGSVNAANAAEFFAQPDVDGALVGGASLKAADFIQIVEAAGK